MNADQVDALGGWCELAGVGFLVRDLMSLAHYRGIWGQVAAFVASFRAVVMAWARTLFRRPGEQIVHQVDSAVGIEDALDATVRTTPGPFIPRRERTLREEIAELGLRVNQLQEQIGRERLERDQAIEAEREERRRELQAESVRLRDQIIRLWREVEKLRDATTGDLGLRAESVVFLVLGISLTTWSELFADWLGEWPPFRIAMSLLAGYAFARICWAWWRRQREAEMRNEALERPAGSRR
jgi:hypothetical protein